MVLATKPVAILCSINDSDAADDNDDNDGDTLTMFMLLSWEFTWFIWWIHTECQVATNTQTKLAILRLKVIELNVTALSVFLDAYCCGK